jgi:hypothetical protein
MHSTIMMTTTSEGTSCVASPGRKRKRRRRQWDDEQQVEEQRQVEEQHQDDPVRGSSLSQCSSEEEATAVTPTEDEETADYSGADNSADNFLESKDAPDKSVLDKSSQIRLAKQRLQHVRSQLTLAQQRRVSFLPPVTALSQTLMIETCATQPSLDTNALLEGGPRNIWPVPCYTQDDDHDDDPDDAVQTKKQELRRHLLLLKKRKLQLLLKRNHQNNCKLQPISQPKLLHNTNNIKLQRLQLQQRRLLHQQETRVRDCRAKLDQMHAVRHTRCQQVQRLQTLVQQVQVRQVFLERQIATTTKKLLEARRHKYERIKH